MYKPLLPLRLQLFAEDVTADTEVDNVNETEQPAFTQADLDKAIADRLKREERKTNKTIAELQSELDTLKNGEKPQEEQLATLQTTLEAANQENAQLQLQLESLKAGVQADKLEKFIKLASLSDAEEFAEKVGETLAEFPEFGKVVEEEPKTPHVSIGGHPKATSKATTDAFSAAVQKFI
ncbi:hypothetical protein [Jeotgalibaca porci]|uniref:hypothetical protein n=1 Tax=Jeotgalibaca porci TaxID=1868793 RepID=UPI0035A0266A